MDLEDLLSGLKGEGSLDSRGRFTLDPELMLAKLARYRFADPHAYLLCLVAGLAVQGARRIDLTSHGQNLRIHAACRPLSDAQLRNLLEELVNPSPAAVNQELALGLYGAAREYQVELLSRDGHQEVRWQLAGLECLVEVTDGETPEPGLEVRLTSRSWLAGMKRALRPSTRERAATLSRLRYAPYEVAWNGNTLNEEFDLSTCRVTASVGEGLPGQAQCQQHRRGDLRALIGLGSDLPQLSWLVRGVVYPSTVPLPYRAQCLVEADELKPDLSLAHVVEDERHETSLARLVEELEKTLLENVRLVPPGPGTAQQKWMKELLASSRPLPEELQVMELLRDTRGQKKPIKLALKQQEKYGCVLVGKAGMASTFYGRFVLYRHQDYGWLLDALPIEVVDLVRAEGGRIVPGRVTAAQTVDLLDPQPDLYYAIERFECSVGRGAAGIPRTPCTASAQLTLYSHGTLTPQKPTLLPPGLELVIDRPAPSSAAPTVLDLGPQLVPLYRALLAHLDDPDVLTYLLGWLAAAGRAYDLLRRNLIAVEASAGGGGGHGLALGPVARQLLTLSPAQALLEPAALPDFMHPQLDKLAQAVDLAFFANWPLLPTQGERRPVRELLEGSWPYSDAAAGPGILRLTVVQASLLTELLGPGRLKRV